MSVLLLPASMTSLDFVGAVAGAGAGAATLLPLLPAPLLTCSERVGAVGAVVGCACKAWGRRAAGVDGPCTIGVGSG
jgi:hypothetical protein